MAQLSKGRLVTAIALRVVLIAAAIGAGLLVYWLLVWTKPQVATTAHVELQRVPVFEARPVQTQRQWRGFGVAQTMDAADVPARVTAVVERIPDEILAGAAVERGDLLVELDASDFRRRVEIARQDVAMLDAQLAQLAIEQQRLDERLELEQQDVTLAHAELDRFRQMQERGAANQQDVDRARRSLIAVQRQAVDTRERVDALGPRRQQLEAQLAGARSALELAQLEVERSRITSPITGVVQTVDVELGESVAPGERVARVVDLGRIEVPLRLPAAARARVRIGDQARLAATNRSGLAWSATVARISPEDSETTRTFTVFVEVDQQDAASRLGGARESALLVPGMFLEGVVTCAGSESRWVVPRRSVLGGRVMVIEDGIVRSRPVEVEYVLDASLPELGAAADDQWAVLADPLEPGELVVLSGSTALLDGEAVVPVLPVPTAKASGASPAAPREGTP